MNKTFYSMERWYLAELLLLLAEDNAADMKEALKTEDEE